jgi:LAO/AO transport system kinase
LALKKRLDFKEYTQGIFDGNKIILSKAITLLESSKKEDRDISLALLKFAFPKTGKSFRIGITGVPGSGKSTFIELLGQKYISLGKKVAVLTIDPSSGLAKGSILADKTRMEELSKERDAFIRPSPAGMTLGGLHRCTRQAMLLCEAAGFDIILIETVGVGQSETVIKKLADAVLLLMVTGTGDELQFIKKGIIEIADIIVVNKADEENVQSAEMVSKEIQANISYQESDLWKVPVLTSSSLNIKSFDKILSIIKLYETTLSNDNLIHKRRTENNIYWLHELSKQYVIEDFYNSPKIISLITNLEESLSNDSIIPEEAADQLLKIFKPIE